MQNKDVFTMDEAEVVIGSNRAGDFKEFTEVSTNTGVGQQTTSKQTCTKNVCTAPKEKDVRQLRLLIFVVLIISLTGSALVFMKVRDAEQKKFESTFHEDATKLLDSLGRSLERALGAIDALSVIAVASARITNQTFPFVSVPHFALHAAKHLPLTGGITANFLPVVTFEQRQQWELYAATNNTNLGWVNEALHIQDTWDLYNGPRHQNLSWKSDETLFNDFGDVPYNQSRPGHLDIHLPQWNTFPVIVSDTSISINYDWYNIQYTEAMTIAIEQHKAVIERPSMIPTPNEPLYTAEMESWCIYYQNYIRQDENCMEPLTCLYYPVIDSLSQVDVDQADNFPESFKVHALLAVEFYWRQLIKNILPPGSNGAILVGKNTCGPNDFTYKIDGPNETYLGPGDLHDAKYDGISISSTIYEMNSHSDYVTEYTGLPLEKESCTYSFHVYPSDEMRDLYITNNAIIFSVSALAFIIIPFLLFVAYDRKVTQQKGQIIHISEQSDAIISSLFPSHIKEKLYPSGDITNAPMADFYPETTVLFADITAFTAWCSVRDPNQVFILLETIFLAFDSLAERDGVFKVETVGDCYVAVVGLPEPRAHHAMVMAIFAQDMLTVMAEKTAELETRLGPGTSSLTLRVGLNSGPTTAGVLRGAKGRFQLFGDTVNTAARIESNSKGGRIMCSQKTADLIIASGKEHWITPRSELIEAKGKGKMQCYWCKPKEIDKFPERLARRFSITSNSSVEQTTSCRFNPDIFDSNKSAHLVDWISDVFECMLRKVISRRVSRCEQFTTASMRFGPPRDEVVESIVLPRMPTHTQVEEDNSSACLELSTTVKTQIRQYTIAILEMYRENPFHNFEHACHVVMATKKLLSRVIKPTTTSVSQTAYGITSDPLTQFAIVFSAFIHDIDHPGVSNAQLVKENTVEAVIYDNKSVAEQNSITKAWDLLMDARFSDLRDSVMASESDCIRFRQLVVNSVMATDLFDVDLKNLRDIRWHRAFDIGHSEHLDETATEEDSNRRATIVLEHIIQASDVSHTMQHWQVYKTWNRRLFREMYLAFVTGRLEQDPVAGWYEGELWFFDNYIIPLAKKLKTCGVFGVSCDELLHYATDNRAEWASKGHEIVAGYIIEVKDAADERWECSKTTSLFAPELWNLVPEDRPMSI